MKIFRLITKVLFVIFFAKPNSYSQTIILGKVNGPGNSCFFKNCRVDVVIGDSILRDNAAICQNNSLFSLVVPPVTNLNLIIDYNCCGSFLYETIIIPNQLNDIGEITIDTSKRFDKCPIDSTDKVIPIVRGLVRGKEVWEAVENGEIILGGCTISDCDPKLYCPRHIINF